jgi:thiosulfate reductase cytochrome b subunit
MQSGQQMASAEPMMDTAPPAAAPYLFHRHALAVRVTHWINALAILILLGTGLNIFNAHPSLYWGQAGSDQQTETRWLQIGSRGPDGYLRIGGVEVKTTGVLGVSQNPDGGARAIAYPGWATIPAQRNLAAARTIHFFFAWVLIINAFVWLGYSLISGHIRRDLLPKTGELSVSNISHDIVQHAKLKFPKGEDAKRYHILQKLAYGGVIFVLIPLVIFTGMGMSPGANAYWPWILDLFGGRASARSLHWIAANLILAFLIVHLLMVLLAGPFNEIRSMITGTFRVEPQP